MRIAMIAWEARYGCPIGSISVHVHELGRELVRNGQEIHLFTRQAPGQNAEDLIEGIYYHRIPVEPSAKFLQEVQGWCRSVRHYITATEPVTGPFHVIHAHDWLTFGAALPLTESGKRRLVTTFHTTETSRAGVKPTSGDALAIANLEQAAAREAGAVIATTYRILRLLRTDYRVADWRTELIYNGIRTDLFDAPGRDPGEVKQEQGIAPMDPMMLFVGRLGFDKGPDILLEALAHLKNDYPSLKAVLVGEGPMKDHLVKEMHRFGIAGMVRFAGNPKPDALIDLYKTCDFVCAPSRTDAFGIVPLTAWAAHKPVIVTRGSAPEEYVLSHVNGMSCFAAPDQVADSIRQLLESFDNLRWMGANGRSALEEAFLWKHAAERTLSLYRGVDAGTYSRSVTA